MKIKSISKVVVLNPAGQVLLLRRSETDRRRPGEWDFPGGKIDPGEDVAEAAAREASEEANLRVDVKSMKMLYAATEYYEPDNQSLNRFLLAARVSAEQADNVKLSFEHDAFEWMSIERALEEFPHPFYGVGLGYAQTHGLLED